MRYMSGVDIKWRGIDVEWSRELSKWARHPINNSLANWQPKSEGSIREGQLEYDDTFDVLMIHNGSAIINIQPLQIQSNELLKLYRDFLRLKCLGVPVVETLLQGLDADNELSRDDAHVQ